VGLMLEPAVSLAVTNDIRRSRVPDRQSGRPPQGTAILVAHEENLARPIGHGIVRPGRQLVFPAVDGPGVTGAFGRNLETEGGVGDHVDPGRRRHLSGVQRDHVFPAVCRKSADTVEELKLRYFGFCRSIVRGYRALPGRRRGDACPAQAIELIRQASLARRQHDPGNGGQ